MSSTVAPATDIASFSIPLSAIALMVCDSSTFDKTSFTMSFTLVSCYNDIAIQPTLTVLLVELVLCTRNVAPVVDVVVTVAKNPA